jgi:hypothetical protein
MTVSSRPASSFDRGMNARREGTHAPPGPPSAAYSAASTAKVYSRADLQVSRCPRYPAARAQRGQAARRPGHPVDVHPTRAGLSRADTAASQAASRQWRRSSAGRPAPGTMWTVSESFPEPARAVLEHAQHDRIDIVRAKRHLLGQLGDGQPCSSGTLIVSVAALLGADHWVARR